MTLSNPVLGRPSKQLTSYKLSGRIPVTKFRLGRLHELGLQSRHRCLRCLLASPLPSPVFPKRECMKSPNVARLVLGHRQWRIVVT